MAKVKVYCGEKAQQKNRIEYHPVVNVLNANSMIHQAKKTGEDQFAFSNCPDFVRAIKYIGLKEGVETEFFLNDVSCGNDIEPIFADFNRALDMINLLGATED